MKFPQPHTLEQIANLIDCEFIGDNNFPVLGMNEIHVVEPGDIVFVDHPKYYDKALDSAATIVLINKEVSCPEGKALLISEDPFRDFNKLTQFFKPFQKAESLISSTAIIGENVTIQPGAFIGNHVQIGANSIIHANVSIYDHTVIGENVIIHSNTVLGGDAFYYKRRPEGYDRLLSSGNVVIEDHVEIGVSCTIDKGVSASTTIKKGTKIDNLVHIGHDTVVGENCLMASQIGVSGCTTIGNRVTIWGQVGIASGIEIVDDVIVSAKSGVTKSIKKPGNYFGLPATDIRSKFKELAAIKQIPSLIEKVNKL